MILPESYTQHWIEQEKMTNTLLLVVKMYMNEWSWNLKAPQILSRYWRNVIKVHMLILWRKECHLSSDSRTATIVWKKQKSSSYWAAHCCLCPTYFTGLLCGKKKCIRKSYVGMFYLFLLHLLNFNTMH